jgi:hypothetical protein
MDLNEQTLHGLAYIAGVEIRVPQDGIVEIIADCGTVMHKTSGKNASAFLIDLIQSKE